MTCRATAAGSALIRYIHGQLGNYSVWDFSRWFPVRIKCKCRRNVKQTLKISSGLVLEVDQLIRRLQTDDPNQSHIVPFLESCFSIRDVLETK